jgi:hypothetical protein
MISTYIKVLCNHMKVIGTYYLHDEKSDVSVLDLTSYGFCTVQF